MSTKVFLYLNNKSHLLSLKDKPESSLLSYLFRPNKKDSQQLSVSNGSNVVNLVSHDTDGTRSLASFGFDHIFDESSSSRMIYELTSHDMVTHFFEKSGNFTNASLIIFGSTFGSSLKPLPDMGNDGIAHMAVEDLFREMSSREYQYEVSYSVSELCGNELKNIEYDNNDSLMIQAEETVLNGKTYLKCDSKKKLLHSLTALQKLDDVSRFVTIRIQNVKSMKHGFFRILFLSENELLMPSGSSITMLSSLERIFTPGHCHDDEETTASKAVTDLLKGLIENSNVSLVLSPSILEPQSDQTIKVLRLGTAGQAMGKTVSFDNDRTGSNESNDNMSVRDLIPETVVIHENLDLDYGSASHLSLRASMINSSIMKLDIGYEDKEEKIGPSNSSGEREERDGPTYDSSIFINLGKHLYEENQSACDQACQANGDDNDAPSKPSKGLIPMVLSMLAVLLMVSGMLMSLSTKMTRNESSIIHYCDSPIFPNNSTINNLNYGHFEVTRLIISFIQDVDSYLTERKDIPEHLNYVPFGLGISLLLLAFAFASSVYMISSLFSMIGLHHKNTKLSQKSKSIVRVPRQMKTSGNQKLNMTSESPYLKHPKIMSPIDPSNIFMSRYTGEVITNNGLIAEVVRSSRIATPSPCKFSTPLSYEKAGKSTTPKFGTPVPGEMTIKSTPLKPKVLPVVKEEM